jgi:hypothetical protein
MVGAWFDDLSRAFALVGSRRGIFRGLLAAVTGRAATPAFVPAAAEAASVPLPCNGQIVFNCTSLAFKRTEMVAKRCLATCQALPTLKERALRCRACIQSMFPMAQAAVRQCHTQVCGAKARCMPDYTRSGIPLGPGHCCPPGSRPISAGKGQPVKCAPKCGGLTCRQPFKLNAEYCLCTCDIAAPCPAGKSRDVPTCECVGR